MHKYTFSIHKKQSVKEKISLIPLQNINKFTEVYIFVPSITIRRKLPYMESRVKEIDYLKCIFIT